MSQLHRGQEPKKVFAGSSILIYDDLIGGNRAVQRRDVYRRLYSGVNWRLRSFAGGRLASWCRPTSIIFLLTELCNARCVHCDIWKNRGKEDSPTPEQWKTVLKDLRKWLGPIQVTFSGGEALLRPFTLDLVRCASGLGLSLEVLTHGYWDDQSRIEALGLANPWRITVSVDGIGETHTRIRGRDKFWEKTYTTLQTLSRIRREKHLDYKIQLKTVVMKHNLHDVAAVARFAKEHEMEVFYQAIEQNYNTVEDPLWFEHSDNWPNDADKAVASIQELIELKRTGLPIANSRTQLEVMIPYFRNPASWSVAVQHHSAHEQRLNCSAMGMLQLQANGDVRVCSNAEPVGNVKRTSIREIWEGRPHLWEEGCCLQRRCANAEKQAFAVLLPRQ